MTLTGNQAQRGPGEPVPINYRLHLESVHVHTVAARTRVRYTQEYTKLSPARAAQALRCDGGGTGGRCSPGTVGGSSCAKVEESLSSSEHSQTTEMDFNGAVDISDHGM